MTREELGLMHWPSWSSKESEVGKKSSNIAKPQLSYTGDHKNHLGLGHTPTLSKEFWGHLLPSTSLALRQLGQPHEHTLRMPIKVSLDKL